MTNKKQLKDLKNKILFLLDSSGSMGSIARPTVDAFNAVLQAIKTGTEASGQETTVSFYTFGEHAEPVSRKYFDMKIELVRPLTYGDYRAQGGTPMLDAVGTAIEDSLRLRVDKKTSFVVNIVTDGEENESSLYSADEIRRLMDKVQSTDRWTVTFLVPNGKKQALMQRYGIPEGNVQEWTASAQGVYQAAQAISTGYSNYFTTRSTGQTFTRGFFTTNMANVTSREVKKALTNIAADVIVLKVPREVSIQEFIEDSGFDFTRGNGYYQLTKDEKIQSYKQILLKEKSSSSIYGGQEARDILGLPDGQNVKVRPGNHGNWDIFVQSKSNNRKLVRGTIFLYKM